MNKLLIIQLGLSIFSMIGTIIIGYHKNWIWKFAHTQNIVSALYFVYTKQYGFLIENIFYALIFINNQKQWNIQNEKENINNA